MSKTLRCYFGFHQWRVNYTSTGEYKCCNKCGHWRRGVMPHLPFALGNNWPTPEEKLAQRNRLEKHE